jgi:hypothetical protein
MNKELKDLFDAVKEPFMQGSVVQVGGLNVMAPVHEQDGVLFPVQQSHFPRSNVGDVSLRLVDDPEDQGGPRICVTAFRQVQSGRRQAIKTVLSVPVADANVDGLVTAIRYAVPLTECDPVVV